MRIKRVRYYCKVKKQNTQNEIILAEAIAHRDRDLFGFGNELDSYRKRLRKGDTLTATKLEALGLGTLFDRGQYAQCLAESKRLQAYFKKEGVPDYEGAAQLYTGFAMVYHGDTDNAMGVLIESIEKLTAHDLCDFKVSAEHALADLFFKLGLFDQSLIILHSHWTYAKSIGDQEGLIVIGGTMASIYRELGRMDECRDKLLELNEVMEVHKLPDPIPLRIWHEWISYYHFTGKPKEAYKIYLTKLANPSPYPNYQAMAMLFKARCLQKLKKNEEAEIAARENIAFNKSHNYVIFLPYSYDILVRTLIAAKKYDEAESVLKKMKADLPDSIGKRYKVVYEQCCSDLYEPKGDLKKALTHLKNSMELEQEIKISQVDTKLKALHLLSEEKWKNKELTEIKNQLQMKRDELEISAIYIKQHETMLSELDSFMKELREDNKRKKNTFKEVHDKIKALQLYESDKQSIEDKINSDQQQYIIQIKSKYPALSNTEARVCSLLRSGLSSKEIAALLIIDVHTVEQHRYRIRKKLGVTKSDDLMMVLNQG
ncbi:MAG: hypothetical protein JWO03_1215 [Bacteroidetes bacterium]|nr:hypothetical protein [Bacteroidota bacterium]